jgi:hypothetical protein
MYNINFAAPCSLLSGWRSEMFTTIFEDGQNVEPIYNTFDLIIHSAGQSEVPFTP